MLSEKRDEPDPTEPESTSEVPTPEEPTEEVLLETVEAESFETGQLVEACPACGTLMDVTEQAPFAKIYCPSCGQSLRARRQFNNYQLLEVLGEGGMGSVFKARDCNLRRNVALKILKKECSANAEEKAKLEQEARITASINHPHVVKVFSFGQDREQFYLAMELVEKGSLDQLMTLQRRVAEAQVLNVGIQIAEGLEAALEAGLIHRDIKPGNILFADPHTAKLVDFGLAVVMDDAARESGEIWGTPYYIAPEKLDNLPEDFRSDIYSLGGSLFHALAGRPPYEAATASMVALKQLKSQPISLQAFAPDVSSETAYVINRMLAKDPKDRYNSYRELIEHLSYARHKLNERAQKPPQAKTRVVVESQSSRNFTAYLSLALLVIFITLGVLVYVFRHDLFGDRIASLSRTSTSTSYSVEESLQLLKPGIALMNDGVYGEAQEEFARVATMDGIQQPAKNWALLNQGVAALANRDSSAAQEAFQPLTERPESAEGEKAAIANFFPDAARLLVKGKSTIPGATHRIYSASNHEAMALLAFGLHDWSLGKFQDAAALLQAYADGSVDGENAWINDYKPFAQKYLTDYQLLEPIEKELPNVKTPEQIQSLLEQVRQAQSSITTAEPLADRLLVIEKTLQQKGAN